MKEIILAMFLEVVQIINIIRLILDDILDL